MSRVELEAQLENLHRKSFAWSLSCCGGNREEAEEVLQLGYLKVLDGRARFGGRSSFKTWLFAVIRRTAQVRRRQATARRWLLAGWISREPRNSAPSTPEARLQNSERSAWIRATLAALSPRQRQVLELVFYHDLTVREAADVLGVTIGTARVHYDRGKKELLKRLQGEVLDEWRA